MFNFAISRSKRNEVSQSCSEAKYRQTNSVNLIAGTEYARLLLSRRELLIGGP